MLALLPRHDEAWRWVVTLGGGQADFHSLRRRRAKDRVRADEICERVRSSQVVACAAQQVSRVPAQPVRDELSERLTAAAQQQSRFEESVLPIARTLLERAAAAGGGVMKGFALRSRYANPALRNFRDIDLYFHDFETALPFLTTLRSAGWQWATDELPWMKWDARGRAYGQWAIDAPDRRFRIDTHIGPYSVGHSGLLPLERFETRYVEGVPISVPQPEEMVALLAAHAAGHYFLRMKDVNDLAVLAQEEIDWARTRRLAKCAAADASLGQLAWWTRHAYDRRDLTDVMGAADWPLPVVGNRRRSRVLHTAWLTFRQEARAGRPVTGVARASGALFAYTRRLEPRLGSVRRPAPTAHYRRPSMCWRFVPPAVWRPLATARRHRRGMGAQTATESLPGNIEMVRRGSAVAARLDGDIFLLTVGGAVTSESILLARQLDGGQPLA